MLIQPIQNTVRLNKFIAQNGLCSRRTADELINDGLVTVNGQRIKPGTKINITQDQVSVRGKPVIAIGSKDRLTLALHKPIKVVTTTRDPQGRSTVLDLLPPELQKLRPNPVGRLDFLSDGLLLLTTDGELCNRLTHPRHHVSKTYQVRLRGKVPKKALSCIRSGMTLMEGDVLAPVQTRILSQISGETLLEMILIQGVNRQIRRMCRDLNLDLFQLTRIALGPVLLGNLKLKNWRKITSEELQKLRQAVHLS